MRLKIPKPLFITLCIAAFFITAKSNPDKYRFETWGVEQGLPYKTVASVLQTRDGYIWAATWDGLARFDGVKFTVFNTANTRGMVTNRLGIMVETNDGSLWIEAERRGLIRYQNGVFTNYTTANGLPDNWIWSLQYFPSENLLRVGTPEGLARFDGEKFIRMELTNLSAEVSNQVLTDNTGAIWKRFGDEIRRVDGKSAETLYIPKIFSEHGFNFFYKDRSGNYWLAFVNVVDGYVLRFRNGNVDILSVKDGLPGGIVNAIFEDSKGTLWFGSKESGGLSIYQNGKFHLLTKEKDGLPSNGFQSFTEDREGGVWAGTSDGGLIRFSPQVINTYSKADGLISENVYPMYEDRNSTVWIGAWGNKGLHKYENGKFSTVIPHAGLFTSLFQDRDGALWIGCYNLIGKYEDENFSVVMVLPAVATSVIAQDGAGTLWFGSGDGLRRITVEELGNKGIREKKSASSNISRTPLFPYPPTAFTVRDGLPNNDVKALHFDLSGKLWIGTLSGLAKYENERLTAYTEKDGLSGNHVRSIYEDSEGTLWIGTYDNGLTRLKDGKFTAYRVKDGLFDQGVFQILEDERGWFWISSNRGIYRVNKNELNEFAEGKRQFITSVSYGVKDGMLDAECNGGTQPSGFKSKRDGRLWFPTQKGVVVIDPKAIYTNQHAPFVSLEECLLDRQSIDYKNGVEILPGNDGLQINYTGISFNKPEQIRFKYRLEGLDKDWIDAGTRRYVYYSYLPPGKYTFRVIAANVEGVWNETGASIQIIVRPPFWRTWWFISLCVVFTAFIVAFVYRARVQNLKKAHAAQEFFSKQLLESQEQERQRIAVELHDSLGQDLLIIKNWALLGLNANGDETKIKNQLSEISATASQAIEEVREIAYNLRPYQIDELGLTKAIESMMERVSESSTIHFFSDIDTLDGFFSKEHEINFYRIVQECINNIIKHSGANRASVSIKREEGKIQLIIKDNGSGFNLEKVSTRSNGNRGFGLTGIQERTRILGGKIVINSVPMQGTTISMTLNQ